ncbi:MAG: DUF1405 domain-containing protein [Firmicutes bacterium]|nr:DUF1405 domain-containing protein [Bacillota bacterium]
MANGPSQLIDWFKSIPLSRRWLGLLLAVNLFGTGYGIYWYREQLAATPVRFWPVVPDSPTAVLLFSLMLYLLLRGLRKPLLEAFAYAYLFKYGLWTVLVIGRAVSLAGEASFEDLHLSLSHAGMAVESILFARVYRPRLSHVLVAGAWLLFNDYMDYFRLFHPDLPQDALFQFSKWIAIGLSLAAVAVLGRLAGGRGRSALQPD